MEKESQSLIIPLHGQVPKILTEVNPIPPPPKLAPNTKNEVQMLLSALPVPVRHALEELEAQGKDLNTLMELNVQIGRKPEAVFMDPKTGRKERVFVVDAECNEGDVQLFSPLFERGASSNKRAGLPGTLHRLSFTTHPGRQDTVVAVTARVGRAMEGVVARMAPFLLEAPGSSFSSLLLIGRPGVGKTTLLRELACALSHDTHRNVVVVDKTCEIAGDDIRPHPAIGTARWMPVGRSGLQPQVMREAVENQTPDIIICDEIRRAPSGTAARGGVSLELSVSARAP
mmetsp:Transcript_34282/g.90552  ORF Transcript_34282/g.90552 Transcript_34282/m.90552 type:complete len:286 (-) Transcript_34282:1877-2734(-)